MLLESLFLIKMAVSILFVLALSLLAEYVSPKASGIISGIPTGTAIILFFYGIEQGPAFAAESSLFNLVGMLSMQVFIYLYLRFSNENGVKNILVSSVVATGGYLLTIAILKQFNFTLITALVIPIISIPLFMHLFKHVKDTKIKNKVHLAPSVLFVRAFVASLVILLLINVANIIGPAWAGLLSAFPTTLFPLILIIHYTYGNKHVHTIIKNVPKGQWAMALYIVGVFLTYPSLGVYWGTLISYSVVIAYLVLIFLVEKKFLLKRF